MRNSKLKNIVTKIVDIQVKERKNWTDSKIQTNAKIKLISSSSNNSDLVIDGKGYDGKCAWCKSFRTALTGYLNIEYRKRCRFQY